MAWLKRYVGETAAANAVAAFAIFESMILTPATDVGNSVDTGTAATRAFGVIHRAPLTELQRRTAKLCNNDRRFISLQVKIYCCDYWTARLRFRLNSQQTGNSYRLPVRVSSLLRQRSQPRLRVWDETVSFYPVRTRKLRTRLALN